MTGLFHVIVHALSRCLDRRRGAGGRVTGPALTLAEAVEKATTDPSYGVARLECGPGVVGVLRSLAPESPPPRPWQPAPIVPLAAVPVVCDESMMAGRWRMVDRAGGVVWEGVDVGARAGASR